MLLEEFPYSELYESQRWLNDSTYWTPMAVLSNYQHIFIGDIIEYSDSKMGKNLGKVENIIFMVCKQWLTLKS